MGAGGDGSRTLCARSPLAEEWARSIANCCSTPPLRIPCSKINQQELQIEKAFSGARPQFHLDQRLEDSVLRGQEIMRNRDKRKETKEREIHRERSGESLRQDTGPNQRQGKWKQTEKQTCPLRQTEINKEEKQMGKQGTRRNGEKLHGDRDREKLKQADQRLGETRQSKEGLNRRQITGLGEMRNR